MRPTNTLRRLALTLEPTDVAQLVYDGSAFTSLSLAIDTVNIYLIEGARQHARIRAGRRAIRRHVAEARADIRQPLKRSLSPSMTPIHFYASCWTIVGRHLCAIRDISKIKAVGVALRPYVRSFETYADLRDHFEHLDERLPGRKNAHRVGHLYGRWAEESFGFGNKKVDIARSSLELLRAARKDVFAAFTVGSISALAEQDPERLKALVYRARHKRMSRALSRFGISARS